MDQHAHFLHIIGLICLQVARHTNFVALPFSFSIVVCWSATGDHVKAEEVLNDRLGCVGTLVKDTAGATRALTCGMPDREPSESKCLEDALEMINDWKSRYSRRSSEGHADQEPRKWCKWSGRSKARWSVTCVQSG